MKSYRLWAVLILIAAAFAMSGCLNLEAKEYRFKLNPDGTGEGTITFINIVSQDDEERDVSLKDFGELITDYLEGTSWESDKPGFHVTNKRLYVQDDKLMGEVTFTFSSLDSAGFFTFPGCGCAPVLYQIGQTDETYSESNGSILGNTDSPSFLSWDAGSKEFYFRTIVLSDLENTRSLAEQYKAWEKTKK